MLICHQVDEEYHDNYGTIVVVIKRIWINNKLIALDERFPIPFGDVYAQN